MTVEPQYIDVSDKISLKPYLNETNIIKLLKINVKDEKTYENLLNNLLKCSKRVEQDLIGLTDIKKIIKLLSKIK